MRVFACAVLALLSIPCAAEAAPRIKTLSTRPDMVTGGDVLVKVAGTPRCASTGASTAAAGARGW